MQLRVFSASIETKDHRKVRAFMSFIAFFFFCLQFVPRAMHYSHWMRAGARSSVVPFRMSRTESRQEFYRLRIGISGECVRKTTVPHRYAEI